MNNLPARSSKITKRILVCYDAPGFRKAPMYDRAILAKECQKRKSLLLE